jgi:hypothetical protein
MLGRTFLRAALVLCLFFAFSHVARAQGGNAGSISGVVKDQSGAVVPGATVEITNPVSGYTRTTTSGAQGQFAFENVPFNPYHLTATAQGFAEFTKDVDVRSAVTVNADINLSLASSGQTVTVTTNGEDLVETDSTDHTDVDKNLFDKLPLESTSSGLSSLITLASPGVAADSNGLIHGLGNHASNSISLDGQSIHDQFSKVFSNQLPVDAIQSMEVIDGAPPAEYGDKTALVIKVTTRSGEGVTTPTGSVYTSYGSFGTANAGFDLAFGGKKWGNFVSVSGLQTGRFLDPPEFEVMHDKGNEGNFFDRVDYKFNENNSLQFNFWLTRSWFQTPNSYDGELADAWSGLVVNNGGVGPDGRVVPVQDQRSKIVTFDIAPTYTHVINTNSIFTFGAYSRRDAYNYYPSADPFADFTPDLQSVSVSQNRSLFNNGVHAEYSYVKGINNLQVGATYEQTFLTEDDGLGIVDPTVNAVCEGINGPITTPSIVSVSQCAGIGATPNPNFVPILGCYDLTRPNPNVALDGCPLGNSAIYYPFHGHTDVKEMSMYVDDTITKGPWSFRLGIRGDLYNGLTIGRQAEPRIGIAYNIKKTNTVLRLSYAREMETPFNENLVISSGGCGDTVVAELMTVSQGFPCATSPLQPGWGNEFHAGFEQAFGKYLVISGEYIWEYTHYGFDFNVLASTPITLPIEWQKSKIPGWTLRASMPNFHGLSALVVMSSVAARFFPPTEAGIGPAPPPGVFRIDHDEFYNENTHLQYQPWKNGPWIGFNWRYDSGLVSGATPCFADTATCAFSTTTIGGVPTIQMLNNVTGLPLTPDQEFEGGFECNGVRATLTAPLPFTCPASQFSSFLISVPAPGTENDDHNPQRISPRNLFDAEVGDDNLFHGDHYQWSLRLTVINVANAVALYNYYSTFSGTHYVTPRTVTAQLGFHF